MLIVEPIATLSEPTNFLLKKQGFVVSYNELRGIANFVIWNLSKENIGNIQRQSFFSTEKLPKGFYRPRDRAYNNSGFDRGHLCPAEDRSAEMLLSLETFCMSNIIPQTKFLNERTWKGLEDYCRKLTTQKNAKLQIIAGCYGTKSKIANGFIFVPTNCYKVVEVTNIDGQKAIFCIDMPNDDKLELNWQVYQTTIEQIQVKAGIKIIQK